MDIDKLEADEKSFNKNLGYATDLKDIVNDIDPFRGDANGFKLNSIAHKAYKIRINTEHGPEDSYRAASVSAQSRSYYEGCVDLFTCPQCKLCFVHPKRFLIHFKWHNFGIEYKNWCISDVTSSNVDFLAKKMVYYCFCFEKFSAIKELGHHVKKSHGLPKLDLTRSNLDNDSIDPKKINELTKKNNLRKVRISLKTKCKARKKNIKLIDKTQAEGQIQLNQNKAEEIEEPSNICFKTNQGFEMANTISIGLKEQKIDRLKSKRKQKTERARRQNETEQQYIARIEEINRKKRARKLRETEKQRAARLEKLKIYRRERKQNETEEQRIARLEKLKDFLLTRKQNETDEQRKKRLERRRFLHHNRVQNETEEQRCARLERNRLRKQNIYENETEAQRNERLEKFKTEKRNRKQKETEEEKFARLERRRIYMREYKLKLNEKTTNYVK